MPGGKQRLPHGRRLLVAGHARGSRIGPPNSSGVGRRRSRRRNRAPAAAARAARRRARSRSASHSPRRDVEQQRARGVGGVGRVRAAGQPPEQEAVDGAEGELAPLRAAARAPVDVVEEPGDLGGREIGIEHAGRCSAATCGSCPRRLQRARTRRRCAGPATRWRCGSAARSRGPRRSWSRAGW